MDAPITTGPNAVNSVLPGGNGDLSSGNGVGSGALSNLSNVDTSGNITQGGGSNVADYTGTTPINSSSLSSSSPINYSTPNLTAVPSVSGLNDYSTPALTATPLEGQANDLSARIEGLNNDLVGKSAYQTQQDTAAGVDMLNQQQTDLSTQLSQLKNEALAIPQQLQLSSTGRGITAGGLAPLQTASLRTNAIAALGISSLLDATKGLLASAQAKADKAVAAKYDPIQEQITAATNNLNLILKSPEYSLEEKNRAQQQLDIQNQKQAALDKQKQDAKDVLSAAQTAAANGADASTLQKMQAAPDGATALQIAVNAGYGNADIANLMMKYPDAKIAPGDSLFQANQKIQSSPTYTLDQKSKALDNMYKSAQIGKLNADAQAALAADAAVNPDVLQGMLNVYKSTGVLPSFGLSAKSPLRAQFYAALGSPDGAQIVSDANTNKSIRAGLTTAYKTQQNLYSANQTAIGTLDQQLQLAQQYSDQVSRTNSPLVNSYVLGLKTGVFGDPKAAAFNNIVKTAAYEFAKILSGSAASISGVTISSAADAESMLNAAMSKGQFNEVIGLMQKEAQFRLNSQKDQLTQLQSDMGNVDSLAHSLNSASSTYGGVTLPSSNTGTTYSGINLPF